MLDRILLDNGNFHNYGLEHLICFISCIAGIIYIIYLGKKNWNTEQQRKYVSIICALGAFTQLFKVFYRLYLGTFDVGYDLPLHLCNLLTLIMPFIMLYRWKTAWSITYFWVLAGCAQAIFTPTLTESLPNYEAIRYWLVHAVIILGAFYGNFVYSFKITYKDAIRSGIALNLLALIIYPINIALGANYMYLNAKPPGETFYNLLGPWPDYIFMLEIALLILFSIILIPFYWDKWKHQYFSKEI